MQMDGWFGNQRRKLMLRTAPYGWLRSGSVMVCGECVCVVSWWLMALNYAYIQYMHMPGGPHIKHKYRCITNSLSRWNDGFAG